MERLSPEMAEKTLKRFEREAKEVARLTHPNIVKVMDYGEYEGIPYLVMPYLSGGTLKQREPNRVPWQETAQLKVVFSPDLNNLFYLSTQVDKTHEFRPCSHSDDNNPNYYKYFDGKENAALFQLKTNQVLWQNSHVIHWGIDSGYSNDLHYSVKPMKHPMFMDLQGFSITPNNTLVAASYLNQVIYFKMEDATELFKRKVFSSRVISLEFSPNGKYLTVGSFGGEIKLLGLAEK
jgi:WD40 repeat protein